jgi:hypothetical protein
MTQENNPNQVLHDLLVTRNFNPESIDSKGKSGGEPAKAVSFKFDYKGESGKDYGTAVAMINAKGLTLFFGDNLGKSMDSADKNGWFSFLEQLKNFAIRDFGSEGQFNISDISKLKYSMQGQAAIKEGLFEGWAGTKTRSWSGIETEARLMIKHKRVIGENDARFRYVESLFVETAEGERYKLPFTKLSAGRAMVEHVRQGGKPYDIRGNHIAQIVEEMNVLNRFRRANQGKIFEGATAQLVESAGMYYETLHHNLKKLSSKTGYTKYFETWDPAAITDEDVIIEDLRHMFVEQNIDSRVEQALPLLAKLQREQEMKEANIFESWANLMLEGTLTLPDTKEKQAKLIELLSQELPVGAQAVNVIGQLEDLFDDSELFDKLRNLADENADADAREIILNRLEDLKDNPDVAQVIGQLTNQSSDEPEEQEQDVTESRGADYEFETEIINPQWLAWENTEETEDNPLPPEPEKMIPVTVSYNTTGSYQPATWSDGGGSPAEGPEITIVSVIDNITGEQLDPDNVVTGDHEDLYDKASADQSGMSEGSEDPLIQLRRSAGMHEGDMEEGWKGKLAAAGLAGAAALGGYAAGSHSPSGFSNTKGIEQFNKPTAAHVQPLKTQADLDRYNKTRPPGESKLLNLPSDFEEEKEMTEGGFATAGKYIGKVGGAAIGSKVSKGSKRGIKGGALAGGAAGEAGGQWIDNKIASLHKKSASTQMTAESGNWLEGQYGHSGKMKPVEGGDADTISRLKFLSGITK